MSFLSLIDLQNLIECVRLSHSVLEIILRKLLFKCKNDCCGHFIIFIKFIAKIFQRLNAFEKSRIFISLQNVTKTTLHNIMFKQLLYLNKLNAICCM